MTDTVNVFYYEALLDALKKSDYSKEDSFKIISEYNQSVLSLDASKDRQDALSLVTADYINRVLNHEWKFAHGFFGNWAKSAIESKKGEGIDEHDVNDIGC